MIDPKEHPMLLAEPPLNTQQQREKSDFIYFFFVYIDSFWSVLLIFLISMLDRAAELMFEKYKVPALFMAKNPVYSLLPWFIGLLPASCEIRCLTIST